MTSKVRELVTTGLIVLGLGSSQAMAQTSTLVGGVPEVPPNLEVPAGHVLFSKGHATGTQNYICLPAAAGGVAWRFVGPQATLHVSLFGFHPQLATHYLSANPDEAGLARATWLHSIDSSRVWAKATPAQTSSDPHYVEPGAIPWLLLDVVGREPGPDGGSFLTQAVYIQRLNTSGGVAPATGCSQPADVGATARVPSPTDPFIYRPRRVG